MGFRVLLIVSSVTAALAYVAPAATSYIYRSDNNGPASLIQLGPVPYQPIAPLPLVRPQPLGALEVHDLLTPVPLPYIAAKPIVVEDEEDNEDEYLDGDNYYEKGTGSDYEEENHSSHGEKGSKGYHGKGHHARGESGHYGKEHNEGFYKEGEGEKSGHHNEAESHGKHHEESKGYKGGDHGHKKHFSKGEDVTGYHKVFHKDEFKKDHDFYDVADKSGHFNKHGYEKSHHGSEEGGHKKAGHHDSAGEKGEFGKTGFRSKGHFDDAEHGHSAEEGADSHYEHGEDFGKKGGSGHQKEFAYADADDDDDEEDDF